MARVLRSASKKTKDEESLSSKLGISQKSKSIKRGRKKIAEAKSENSSDNWMTSSVLSTIFTYTDFKDLVKFNTVCKKWSQLTNPIIHKSIKLQRSRAIQNKAHDKRFHKEAKADAEIGECIANNSKHAPLIKELTFNEKLKSQRAIEFFETFKYLTKLNFIKVDMDQDQFLAIIRPLSQLKELKLEKASINNFIQGMVYTEPVQLPSTLDKLTLNRIYTTKNSELFIQTINSHTNLKEFRAETWCKCIFLAPFYKFYPSLKVFGYSDENFKNCKLLLNVLKFNPQLLGLHLKLDIVDDKLASHISRCLVNLEELSLSKYNSWHGFESPSLLKFNKPTKIKKLNISYEELSESSLDSILLNTPHVKDLGVRLPKEWKGCIKVISSRCANLECLTIFPTSRLSDHESSEYFKDYNNCEFLSGNLAFKSTLTNLTLNQTDFERLKLKNIETIPNLKLIKLPGKCIHGTSNKDEINLNMNLRPNFKLRKYRIGNNHFDFELIKI